MTKISIVAALLIAVPALAEPSPDAPAEKQFKNLQVMKGAKAGDVIPAMEFMSQSLGVGCDHCHVSAPSGNWPMEKDDKEEKKVARKMITMTRAINQQNFGGEREVTCATCHHGQPDAASRPPVEAVEQLLEGKVPPADELLDKLARAVGGKAAWAPLRARVGKGTVALPDGRTLQIELATTAAGNEVRLTPPPEAQSKPFPHYYNWANIRPLYNKVISRGTQKVNGRACYVISAVAVDGKHERLFVDTQSGLLARRVIYSETLFGEMPEQVDYSDYKEVGGVKLPFVQRRAVPGASSLTTFSEIKLSR